MQTENDPSLDSFGKARDLWKKAMLYGIKHQVGEKIRASTIIGAAISGFRFVSPVDTPSEIFRYICLISGTVGFIMLFFSQPQKETNKLSDRNRRPPKTSDATPKPAGKAK